MSPAQPQTPNPVTRDPFPIHSLISFRIEQKPQFALLNTGCLSRSFRKPPFPWELLLNTRWIRPEDQERRSFVENSTQYRLVGSETTPELVLGCKENVSQDVDEAEYAALVGKQSTVWDCGLTCCK